MNEIALVLSLRRENSRHNSSRFIPAIVINVADVKYLNMSVFRAQDSVSNRDDFCNFDSLSNVIRVIKSRGNRWAGRVATV
jgi:hypothetical protein